MSHHDVWGLNHQPIVSSGHDIGIGVVGAGFIVCDCHLVAYRDAGLRVLGLTSRTRSLAQEVATRRGVERVFNTLEEMLDDPRIDVVDIAVPPAEQPGIVRRILSHPRKIRGILAQKPLAMSYAEAAEIVSGCEAAGIVLQVNQNMRYDPSVRALKTLLKQKFFGKPVLATIEMRAIPHWMSWAKGGRSLSTFLMSIHHLDTFRYWLGNPTRILASTRPDPRQDFPHEDGINLYILEYDNLCRATGWDDVWAGPAREGSAGEMGIRWRFEGTEGLALGTISWHEWPQRVPSTIDYSSIRDGGAWHRPRWSATWFPDAFAGPMGGLLQALETGSEPDISGRDNLDTIALCEAVLRAAHEHRVVKLDEIVPSR